jgi:hypothetical protein
LPSLNSSILSCDLWMKRDFMSWLALGSEVEAGPSARQMAARAGRLISLRRGPDKSDCQWSCQGRVEPNFVRSACVSSVAISNNRRRAHKIPIANFHDACCPRMTKACRFKLTLLFSAKPADYSEGLQVVACPGTPGSESRCRARPLSPTSAQSAHAHIFTNYRCSPA